MMYRCNIIVDLSIIFKSLLNDLLRYEVDKPSKILIKTLNVAEYVKLNILNTKALRIDNPIIYYV